MRCRQGGRIGLVIALAVWACGAAVMAQDAGRDRNREDGDRGGWRDRGGRGRGGPGWGGGPWNWNPTPEQREEFYDRMLERTMERLTETYDLSPVQQIQVRQKLQQYRTQASATAQERMEKRRQAMEQFRKLRERREAGKEVSREEWLAVREQMRTAMPQLMDRDLIISDVEKLLPAAQVERGRERREQQRNEWRERWERERGRDRDGDRGRDGGRERWRDRGRDDDDGRSERRGFRDRRERDRSPREADWRDSWERYTENFCRRYQFDASQEATAQSILRDLLERRRQYEEAHEADFAALRQIQDRELRQQQAEHLNAPIAQLFEELKTKLNQLPTSAQRLAVDPPASTQPAETRPSREDRYRGRDRERSRDSGRRRGFNT